MELNKLGVLSSLEISEIGITDGLVLYYPLNGNANDYGGNLNHGTVYGATVTSGINGKLLYSFDGSDDYIDIGDIPLTKTLTLSLWVNPTTTNNGQCFFGKNTLSGGNIFLFGYWSNGYNIDISGAGQIAVGDLHSGVWDHLVVTALESGSTTYFTLYRNGTYIGDLTLSGTISTLEGTTQLGMEYDSLTKSDYYGGLMSDVRIYNRLLSLLEVNIIYDVEMGTTKMIASESKLYISGEFDEITL